MAILLCSHSLTGSFAVVRASDLAVVYSAPIPQVAQGPWSLAFPLTYQLDFSNVVVAGSYFIRINGGTDGVSPGFRIDSGNALYGTLISHLLFYFQAQRDGPDVISAVMSRQPSHLADATATVYLAPHYNANGFLHGPLKPVAGRVDASGGWFDAGDYVKFVETPSYVEAVWLL